MQKNRKIRILLVHVDAGGGHRAFKENLIRTLDGRDEFEIKVFDTDVRFYENFYDRTVKLSARLWKFLQGVGDKKPWYYLGKIMAILPDIQNAEKILEEFNPDIVITTNAVTSVVYYYMRQRYKLDFKLVTSVLDYGDQRTYLHMNEPADFYLVRDEESKQVLTKYVDASKLLVFGTSVHPIFEEISKVNVDSIKDKFLEFFNQNFPGKKLQEKRKNILIMGGSNRAFKARKLIQELDRQDKYNVFVNCGHDKSFFKSLQKYKNILSFKMQPQETLAVIEKFVDVTILSSLAPATMHELMTVNKYPLFVHSIISGQETPHVGLLREWNIGVFEPDIQRMLNLVEGYFANPAEYKQMLKSAKDIRAKEEKKAEANYKLITQIMNES